jgi:hypothetical protein
MLEDCEKKHLIKQCSRCKQAIPVEQWLQHTLKKTCISRVTLIKERKLNTNSYYSILDASDPNKIHCPLCFTSITPPNDAGWKEHLMVGEGCPKLNKIRTPKQNTKTDTHSKKNTRETNMKK